MAGGKKKARAAAAGDISKEQQNHPMDLYCLEFDGSSKGNPGKAGAGALLRSPDGSVICELTKGVGVATCNVAEYCALIVGLQAALDEGILHIKAQGDSKLVCKQVMGQWKVQSKNLATPFAEVMELVKRFQYFSIHHVGRELNSAADALANMAAELPEAKLVSSYRTSPNTISPQTADEPHMAVDAGSEEERSSQQTGVNVVCESRSNFLEGSSTSGEEKDRSYSLEYGGASKGNPGKAGVGVLLRSPDGSVHVELRALGTATRNVAHYRALVLGLQIALDHGISHIHVQGDSNLVFKQMMGKYKVKDENLQALWREANDLRRKFTKFSISNANKDDNAAACALAEAAIHLPETYSNRSTFWKSEEVLCKHSNLAEGKGYTTFDSIVTKQAIKTTNTLSNAVFNNKSCQALYPFKIVSWSSSCHQASSIHQINAPQALRLPYSVVMQKCMDLSLLTATKSWARVARKGLSLFAATKSWARLAEASVPAMGAVPRVF